MSFNLEDLEGPTTRILTDPNVDLSTISSRRVRWKLLEDTALSLTAEGLKQRKAEVDKMILNIYQTVSQQVREAEVKRKRDEDMGEGTEQDADDVEEALEAEDAEEMDEDEDEVRPPPPRVKKKSAEKSIEEADAELARKLSTEINSRSRRGASNGATATPKKRKVKQSAEMVDSEDEQEKPKKKRSGGARGGFGKEYMLSDSLTVVVGVDRLSRPQVVKKIWEYIHSHELQNPSKRREIICDDAMRAVFGTDKVDMFQMNKVLGRHLHTE